QLVLDGEVEEPARRHRVGADGVDVVRRHLREVPCDTSRVVELAALLVGTEGPVGDAADVQLLVADVEELARSARAVPAPRDPGRGYWLDVARATQQNAVPPLVQTADRFRVYARERAPQGHTRVAQPGRS